MRVISLLTDIGATQQTLLLILNRLLPAVELEPLTDETDLTLYRALFIVGRLPINDELYSKVKNAGLRLIGFYITNSVEELSKIQLSLFDHLFFPETFHYTLIQSLNLTRADIIPHPLHMLDGSRQKRWELETIGFIFQADQKHLAEQALQAVENSEDIVLIQIDSTISLSNIGQLNHLGLALTFDSLSSRLAIICQIPYVRIMAVDNFEKPTDKPWYQMSNVPSLDRSLFHLIFDSVERTYNKMVNYLATFQRRAQNILSSGKIYSSLSSSISPNIVDGHDFIGWSSIMNHLRFRFPSVIIVGDVSLHFKLASIYTLPWIGFIHSTDNSLWNNKEFLISLYHCRALFTPFDKLTSQIKSNLKRFNLKLSIFTFKYPLISMQRFSLNSFLNNQDRGYVQPVESKTRPFLFQSLYSPFMKKKMAKLPSLTVKLGSVAATISDVNDIGEVLIRERQVKDYTMEDDVLIVDSQRAEDRVKSILSSVELIDVSSLDYLIDHLVFVDDEADVIIRCIASGTPVITTSNQQSIQLLGKDYPFLLDEEDVYNGLLRVRMDRLEKALTIMAKRDSILGSIDDLFDIISSLKI